MTLWKSGCANTTCATYPPRSLAGKDKEFLDEYFESLVMPVLSPQIMDAHHPFPHLENKALYIAVMLESQQGKRFGLVPVPRFLPRILYLPGYGPAVCSDGGIAL